MHFSLNFLVLVFPVLALSSSSQVDPPCNVEECADVIDSSGCWNFARSKDAILGCVPKGTTVGVSQIRRAYKYTLNRARFVNVMGVI